MRDNGGNAKPLAGDQGPGRGRHCAISQRPQEAIVSSIIVPQLATPCQIPYHRETLLAEVGR